jgi:hypothetical protein
MTDDRRTDGPDLPVVGPRPLGGLGDLAELLGGDTQRSRRFLGGLMVGALVGAAVAGAALLRRGGRGPRPS